MKIKGTEWLISNWPPPKRCTAVNSAILAFILSPVVLSIFFWGMYLLKNEAVFNRGLYQFESATIGDFLLLPLCWALMSVFYHDSKRITTRIALTNRYLSIVIGISMAILISIQGMTSPYRDWTLPEVGKINIPGIYHSFFLAFMIWSFFTFLFDYWTLVYKKEIAQVGIQSTLYWLILDFLTLFMFLLWRDAIFFDSSLNFFQINIFQEIFVLLLVSLSVVGTLIYKLKPFGNIYIWLVIQFTWWAFLLAGISRIIA
jgi:hypothetical protein